MLSFNRSVALLGAAALSVFSVRYEVFKRPEPTAAGPAFYATAPERNVSPTPRTENPKGPKNPFAVVQLDNPPTNQIDTRLEDQSVVADIETTEIKSCFNDCQQIVERIRLPYPFSDDQYEQALAHVDELAYFLNNNPGSRTDWINIASHAGGNKRQVILAAFALLDTEDQFSMGKALSISSNRRQRLDGVQFLSSIKPSVEDPDESIVPVFAEILQSEQDHYVRGAAVAALNKPELFRGDQEVLNVLSQVMYFDNDNAVRGEALLASARLIENPEDFFTESLDAVLSNAGEYQYFGVRALEEIMTRQTLNGLEISAENKFELGELVDKLLSPEFDDTPAEVRETVDDLYQRFYGS